MGRYVVLLEEVGEPDLAHTFESLEKALGFIHALYKKPKLLAKLRVSLIPEESVAFEAAEAPTGYKN